MFVSLVNEVFYHIKHEHWHDRYNDSWVVGFFNTFEYFNKILYKKKIL